MGAEDPRGGWAVQPLPGASAVFSAPMDLEDFERRARALALAEEVSQVPGFAALHVEPEARTHPLLRDHGTLVRVRDATPDPASGAPRYEVVLNHGSFDGGEDRLERALLFGLERVAERAAADEAVRTDEDLFQAHASYVRGMETPAAWYRRGERMGEDVWVVDLDLFVDLVVPRETWEALRGTRIVLRMFEDELELELPEDASADEALTLEGAGLFEPAAGLDEEDELAADDGRYGDLHLVPYVY